jgi:peptide/nickel transport system substrate-binding protein
MIKKSAKIPLIMLAVSFLLSANAIAKVSENSEPAYGDAMVYASIGDARTLVPILASDSGSTDITGLVFNGLVKYDKDVKITGDLAESWDILNGGLSIVFHLRKGVKWHDGEPFTSKDVEFTYEKLIDPNVKTPYSGDFERVKSFSIIDDYTLRVDYKEPFSPALASWGMPVMPYHLLKDADLNNTPFARHPIGTGPYKFKTWKTGEKIELYPTMTISKEGPASTVTYTA